MPNVTRPSNHPPVSRDLGNLADEWQKVYEKAPEKAANAASELVKLSGKLAVPAAEIIGGGYVATTQLQDAISLLQGKDGTFFKGSTSGTDQAIGVAVHGVLAMVGAGMTIHGALRAAQVIAAAAEKE